MRRSWPCCRGPSLPICLEDNHSSAMKSAVLIFPGSNRERDAARALKLISGHAPAMVFHAETELPAGTDLVVLPGGFSYGDYLRCGAIAAHAPIMEAVRSHVRRGGLALGKDQCARIDAASGKPHGIRDRPHRRTRVFRRAGGAFRASRIASRREPNQRPNRTC